MHDKKKSDSDKTSEQEALEKHVDAMMDPKQPDEPAAQSTPEKPDVPEKEDAGAKTAPQLSSKLRKQIGVSDVPTKPLKIDKLDELTESIAKEDPEPTEQPEPEKEENTPEKPADNDDGIPEDDSLDDARIDEAVDDITAYESDVMLAVADSTAEARNQEANESAAPKKHHALSTIFWTFIALIVILAIGLGVLLVMGDSLTSKLGI